MSRKQRLAQRRAMLVIECSLQRSMLVAQGRQLGLNTGWIKSGDGVLDRLKNMPGWASLLLAAVVAVAPGKIASLARTGLTLWQLWRNLKSAGAKETTDTTN